jgi:hypothetical protein
MTRWRWIKSASSGKQRRGERLRRIHLGVLRHPARQVPRQRHQHHQRQREKMNRVKPRNPKLKESGNVLHQQPVFEFPRIDMHHDETGEHEEQIDAQVSFIDDGTKRIKLAVKVGLKMVDHDPQCRDGPDSGQRTNIQIWLRAHASTLRHRATREPDAFSPNG